MRTILLLLGLLTVIGCVNKCPQRLQGVWVSDKEKTMEFMKKHTKLNEMQYAAFEQLFGNVEIEYMESKLKKKTLPHSIRNVRTDEITEIDENIEVEDLKVIGTAGDSIAVQGSVGLSSTYITTLHLLDGDEYYWIYVADVFGSKSTLNIREYFRKVQQ